MRGANWNNIEEFMTLHIKWIPWGSETNNTKTDYNTLWHTAFKFFASIKRWTKCFRGFNLQSNLNRLNCLDQLRPKLLEPFEMKILAPPLFQALSPVIQRFKQMLQI